MKIKLGLSLRQGARAAPPEKYPVEPHPINSRKGSRVATGRDKTGSSAAARRSGSRVAEKPPAGKHVAERRPANNRAAGRRPANNRAAVKRPAGSRVAPRRSRAVRIAKSSMLGGQVLTSLITVVAAVLMTMLLATFSFETNQTPLPEDNPDNLGLIQEPQTKPVPDNKNGAQVSPPPPTTDASQQQPVTEPDEPDPDTGNQIDDQNPIGEAPVGTIWTTDTLLSGKLDDIAREYSCVGVTLAAYDPQHGYSTYQFGYADTATRRLVTADTKFRVASLTKVVTAMLAMKLHEEGKIDLDEDISTYLGYTAANPNFEDTPITTRMLLQHTSSLYDTDAFMSGQITFGANTTRDLLGNRQVYRRRAPGELHEYSDFGYVVLGAVCEAASGKLLNALGREYIFNPLGIDAAFVAGGLQNQTVASQYGTNHTLRLSAEALLEIDNSETTGHQHNYAVGNLCITALDYAKILNLLVHGGTDGRVRLLSEDSVKEIHKADVLGDRGYMQGLAVRYVAEGFMDDKVYYHTGSAYGTLAQFFYSLETGHIAVVITTGSNSERGIYNSVVVCTKMSQLMWKPLDIPTPTPTPPDDDGEPEFIE